MPHFAKLLLLFSTNFAHTSRLNVKTKKVDLCLVYGTKVDCWHLTYSLGEKLSKLILITNYIGNFGTMLSRF